MFFTCSSVKFSICLLALLCRQTPYIFRERCYMHGQTVNRPGSRMKYVYMHILGRDLAHFVIHLNRYNFHTVNAIGFLHVFQHQKPEFLGGESSCWNCIGHHQSCICHDDSMSDLYMYIIQTKPDFRALP